VRKDCVEVWKGDKERRVSERWRPEDITPGVVVRGKKSGRGGGREGGREEARLLTLTPFSVSPPAGSSDNCLMT